MNFTDQNFKEEALNYEGVVLVVFSSEFCSSCRSLVPVIEELIVEYKDKQVKIGKFNADSSQQVPVDYDVVGSSNVSDIQNGKVVDNCYNVLPKEKIKEKLNLYIN